MDDILAATRKGQGIRFHETGVRSVGRQARGVKCMTLAKGDEIVGAAKAEIQNSEFGIRNNEQRTESKEQNEEATQPLNSPTKLITITENGFGKRCEFDEFRAQSRGGKGVCCHRLSEKTGKLAGIAEVSEEDDLMLITDSGIIIRVAAATIPVYSRTAGGVIVMRTGDNAKITGFAAVKPEAEESGEEGEKND